MSYTYEMTTAGKALIAKAQTGTIIDFTIAELGKGDLTGSPAEFTSLLDNVPTNVKIQQKEYIEGAEEAKITLTYTNENLLEGFYVREIGLYANDPDEGEILFLYCHSDDADYLPVSSYASVEQVVNLIIKYDNASEVTAQILPETNVIRDNFAAYSILKADLDNEPEALVIGEDRIVGRKAGVIDALSPDEVREIENLANNDALFKANVDIDGDLKLNNYFSGFLQSDSLGNITSQAGFVIPWPTSEVPDGFLSCNGASVSRNTYAELFAVIGTEYGNVDDDTFNLPDYRGEFLRGWDNGAGNDPDSATRSNRGDGVTGDQVGTNQLDAMQRVTGSFGKTHGVGGNELSGNGVFYVSNHGGEYGTGGYRNGITVHFDNNRSISPNPAKVSDFQTNPRNVYVQYIIKI